MLVEMQLRFPLELLEAFTAGYTTTVATVLAVFEEASVTVNV